MEEDGEEHWLITPPINQAGWESNQQPLGYKSDLLTAQYLYGPDDTIMSPHVPITCCLQCSDDTTNETSKFRLNMPLPWNDMPESDCAQAFSLC